MTGELASLGSALAFGLSTVLARRFMSAVSPGAGALVSMAANAVVFGIVSLALAWRARLPDIHPAAVGLFILGGLTGTLVGRNLAYASIERLGPTMSTSIRLSNTVFTLVFGLLVLHELPRNPQLLGLAIVTGGLWIGVWSRERVPVAARGGADALGVVMALAGAAAFAAGDTMRRIGLTLTPVPVLGAAVGSTSALLAHLLWSTRDRAVGWPTGPALWRADLWGSAAFNTLAILLLYVALRYTPVAIVSVLYNLQVLVVLMAGPIMLRGLEAIPPGLVFGTVLALAGTVLILLG
jgi:drug/metabolite transporter (DMT)-like permease